MIARTPTDNVTYKSKPRIAIIGAGVSGLSIGRMLLEKNITPTIFEKESTPGGLIRCECVNGAIYHKVGGHVFNSRNEKVLHWFWDLFNKDNFCKTVRHAAVALSKDAFIGYPIENHLYQLPAKLRDDIIEDLLNIAKNEYPKDKYFGEFLRHHFGPTLYKIYFAPYNKKIWSHSVEEIPLDWLQGKLPMPTVKEILTANISQTRESQMVHSEFYYPKVNGSQFIADTLATGLDIRFNTPVNTLYRQGEQWIIQDERYDWVIYCGNARELPKILRGGDYEFLTALEKLEAHGTTSVLCEISPSPYSWVYLPDKTYDAHRIICTGNFSPANSPKGMCTATVEFSQQIAQEDIIKQLEQLPFAPRYLAHAYTPYTYPIQTSQTRPLISNIKQKLLPQQFLLLGRFAEWEYYNMDAAMEAAMNCISHIKNSSNEF